MIKFILAVICITLNALTLMCGWNWFVTPLGAAAMGFVQAIGLNVLIRWLGITDPVKYGEDLQDITARYGEYAQLSLQIILSGTVLLVAWLIKFML